MYASEPWLPQQQRPPLMANAIDISFQCIGEINSIFTPKVCHICPHRRSSSVMLGWQQASGSQLDCNAL